MKQCARCKEQDDGELRTIKMACFYEMDELNIPFNHEIIEPKDGGYKQKLYTIKVCKSCRSSWMLMIKIWYDASIPKPESSGSGIFVRELGSTFEISEEEWYRRHPGIEPCRFKAN
jgi:hypothetical protein